MCLLGLHGQFPSAFMSRKNENRFFFRFRGRSI